MNEKLTNFADRMEKSIKSMANDLNAIRAGRANPHILDRITVMYYGSETPLQQVANITVPEARMIQIQPFDPSSLKDIEKAIMISDVGINPTNDGKTIRLVFPELTEDHRKELVKDVKNKGEACKVAIRNIRRDANDSIKKLLKSSEISEDEEKDLTDEIQKMTDDYCSKADEAVRKKTKELMTV